MTGETSPPSRPLKTSLGGLCPQETRVPSTQPTCQSPPVPTPQPPVVECLLEVIVEPRKPYPYRRHSLLPFLPPGRDLSTLGDRPGRYLVLADRFPQSGRHCWKTATQTAHGRSSRDWEGCRRFRKVGVPGAGLTRKSEVGIVIGLPRG